MQVDARYDLKASSLCVFALCCYPIPPPSGLQMFLTPDALFILVVDMFAYSEHGREDALGQWFDILQARVPGSVVLLCGTHSDSFEQENACSEQVDRFKRGASPQ